MHPQAFVNNDFTATKSAEKDSDQQACHHCDDIRVADYESVAEIIARIKQDVIVTGTILGIPGQEAAIFQIEGMEDRVFRIGTQLMDGFIISDISSSEVTLRNQVGPEVFNLSVGHKDGNDNLSATEISAQYQPGVGIGETSQMSVFDQNNERSSSHALSEIDPATNLTHHDLLLVNSNTENQLEPEGLSKQHDSATNFADEVARDPGTFELQH